MKFGFLAGVSFRRDLDLFIWQPRGVLDELHVEKIIGMLEEAEEEAHQPFDRYTDLSKLELVDLTFDYIYRVSLYRRVVYANRPPVKSAFYAVDRATAEIALTHVVVTAQSPLQVRMYLRKSAAARWLGVDISDLKVE